MAATESEAKWSLDDPDQAMYAARRRPMSTWEWRVVEWSLRTLARAYGNVGDVEMVIMRELNGTEREIVEAEIAKLASA